MRHARPAKPRSFAPSARAFASAPGKRKRLLMHQHDWAIFTRCRPSPSSRKRALLAVGSLRSDPNDLACEGYFQVGSGPSGWASSHRIVRTRTICHAGAISSRIASEGSDRSDPNDLARGGCFYGDLRAHAMRSLRRSTFLTCRNGFCPSSPLKSSRRSCRGWSESARSSRATIASSSTSRRRWASSRSHFAGWSRRGILR